MSGNRCLFAAIIALMLLPGLAKAESSAPYFVGRVAGNSADFLNALAAVRRSRCRTDECDALEVLSRAFDIFRDAAATPTKMGSVTPSTIRLARKLTDPVTINRRLRVTLLSRKRLFPAICARLRGFASTYSDDNHPEIAATGFVDYSLQMALLIDRKAGTTSCLNDALAAIPQPSEIGDAFEIATLARGYCGYSQWSSPDCDRIRR